MDIGHRWGQVPLLEKRMIIDELRTIPPVVAS